MENQSKNFLQTYLQVLVLKPHFERVAKTKLVLEKYCFSPHSETKL